MDEFIICDVCMEIYDGGLRCPRMFKCGHSFCSACITKLLKTCAFCPTCKMPIENENLESISINYILKQVVEKYPFKIAIKPSTSRLAKEDSKCSTQHQVESLSAKDFCKVHKVFKRFRCLTCSVWICGDCVAISHKLCKTLLITEAIKEMKGENKIQIRSNLATIVEWEKVSLSYLGHNSDILEVINDELKLYQQKIISLREEMWVVNRNMERVSDLQIVLNSIKDKLECQMEATNVASSTNDLDQIEEKLNEHFISLQGVVENLKSYKSSMIPIQEKEIKGVFINKNKLMASAKSGEEILIIAKQCGITRYGKGEVIEGKFRIHSMQKEPYLPSSLCITLDNCLKTMTGRKDWPTKIFLQFSSDNECLGDVIIGLSEGSNLATKYILQACLFGEEERSLAGVGIRHLDLRLRGEFICSKEKLFIPSDADFKKLLKEKRKRKWNEGDMYIDVWNIWNLWNWNSGIIIKFGICLNGGNLERNFIPTGKVEEGIRVIQNITRSLKKGERVVIQNCGWVL